MFNRCADCRNRHVPLKWYKFWDAWLCHNCKEKRIKDWLPQDDDC